jgi:hypothetical protein
VTARDTAALAEQMDELTAQVDRLRSAVEAMTLTTDAMLACFHAGYAKAEAELRPGGRPQDSRRDRHGLRVAPATPGGAA